jgi:glyoxylase-like metal-dependent hydrolase (beta-lactamase superfamily II)
MTAIKPLPSDQPYFDLLKLDEGVYAAIGARHPGAYSNAGIIDLGDQTLVFDTFTTPKAGYALRLAAEKLTGRNVDLVVNSHAHSHHWMGNQVFPPHTTMITTHTNRLAMQAIADYLLALKDDPGEFEADMRKQKARLAQVEDRRWQRSLENLVGRMQASLDSLPDIQPRLPNQTFECRLAFHGDLRCAEVIETGGHSASDAYLFLPQERIVFLSDLACFRRQPYMPYGDAARWLEELVSLQDIEADLLVPGHGPVGDQSDLALQVDYMHTLLDLAGRVHSQGGDIQDAIGQSLPKPFDRWLDDGMVHFEANLKTLYQRLESRGRG